MKKGTNRILRIFKERLFIVFIGICCLFLLVTFKFYQLQIIEHDTYSESLRGSVEREIEIPATRGLIFDRYGRPLATNKGSYVLKVDQQVKMDGKDHNKQFNKVLLEVANLLEANGDTYIDNMPISKTTPFTYTKEARTISQFVSSIPYNGEEHRQELLKYSAEEMLAYLKSSDVFNIDESFTPIEIRKIIAIRLEVYKFAYRKYKLVTIADNISQETVAQIEENHTQFPGVLVDVEPIRYYPEGNIMGNILGYTRAITASQYEEMASKGYDKDDIIGQDGIEKTMEEALKGEKGLERVEVDNMGRRVHTIEKDDAMQGNNVFLTIDLDLQKEVYKSVEKRLSEALVDRLKGSKRDIKPLTGHEMIVSLVESNQLLVEKMEKAPKGSKQKEIYEKLTNAYSQLDNLIKQEMTLKSLLIQLLEEDPATFTDKEILLALHEQGSITLSKDTVATIQSNKYGGTEYILIELLENGILKPSQLAVDPFSASAVVVDVNTGEVLALVGYPTFDGNEMISNFNSYYSMLLDNIDSRNLLWNRALMTRKAPGSTFKMISGIAGLETGVITPETSIYDTGTFTKVGKPEPRCWALSKYGSGHGATDIYKALEVSCNYYFYEVAYRLGLMSAVPYIGIDTLTKYVEMFGLHEKTGIELAEEKPNVSTPRNLVETNMRSIFLSLRTMNDEKQAEYVEDVTKTVQQSSQRGIYPFGSINSTGVESEIEDLIQYELKRNLEPLLQDAFKDNLQIIINKTFDNIQAELQLKIEDIVESIISNTISDTSKRTLKSKAKDQMIKHLSYMVDDTITDLIKQSVKEIDMDDLLDAYDHAYTTTYNREMRKNSNPELIAALKEKIEQLDSKETYYQDYVAEKVKYNIASTIADSLLQGRELEWTEAFTVRTAIGQSNNAFTPVQMGRYIAAVANGKEVFDLRVINGIYNNKTSKDYVPTLSKKYNTLQVKDSTMNIIHEGMLRVTKGQSGTARTVFSGFPIDTAAKTGTAQEGGHEHSWFVGFAPYDNPQIAIVTTIYNADGLGVYGTQIARDILTEYFMLEKDVQETTLDNMFVD